MKRTMRWSLGATTVVAALAAAFLAGRALAGGIPSTGALTYSGTLEDATGAALTASHNIQVNFYGVGSGGTTVCNTSSTAITLDNGRFSIALPDACTTQVKASPDVWAEVLVDGASLGRTKIGAVPYAVEAGHATNADNATNATSATTAASANAASGALATTIASLAATSTVPKVTAWSSYTTGLNDANNNVPIGGAQTTAVYRRVGDSIEVQVNVTFNATPQASGAWYVEIPSGLTADLTKMVSTSVGFADAYDLSAAANHLASVFVGGSRTSLLMGAQDAANIYSGSPFTWAAGDQLMLRATVPIAGWTTTSP